MRHVLANLFTYALIAGLVIGAVLFAWARSAQLVIATETEVEPAAVASELLHDTAFDWYDFGAYTYRANCQNCHTADGSGRGMYPPVQRMTAHLGAEGGRAYLVDLVLYGLYTGEYGAPMPPMPELSDAEIAAVNNFLLTRFSPTEPASEEQLYRPRDVAARRGQSLNEWAMARRRPDVPTARELGRDVRVAVSDEPKAVPEGEDE